MLWAYADGKSRVKKKAWQIWKKRKVNCEKYIRYNPNTYNNFKLKKSITKVNIPFMTHANVIWSICSQRISSGIMNMLMIIVINPKVGTAVDSIIM